MNKLPEVPGLETARVLVVDDNRVNRHLLQALLERGGVTRIEMAEDGNDALARLDAFRPDLILLDLMMPNLDGFEMCRRLRALPAWKDLPVLVQSSLNRALLHDLQCFRERTESELSLARKMQERLMPSPERLAEVEAAAGVGIAAHFAPSSELGGDFWDLRHNAGERGQGQGQGQGRTMLYMVDFSGHGVGAALNTFRLHAICQQMDMSGLTPGALLSTVNRRLCALLPNGQFATMLAGVVEPAENRFVYASAGSTRPMVWAPGDAEPLLGDSAGLPLGLLASAEYEERSLPLPPGGRLFLYSDGAIEIPVGNDVLDEPGLAALVAERMDETDGDRFLDGLLDRLRAIGPIDDDLTALLLTRKG
ncbi:PP2C family protein-serine/threonine phosphatase [Azospirillum argentinense]